MRSKHLLFSILISLIYLSACNRGRHLTIISTSTNKYHFRVEYSGHIVVNKQRTAIQYLSPGSYIECDSNGTIVRAENDRNGNIIYKMDGDKLTTQNAESQQILSRAMNIISEQQDKQRLARN